LARQAAVDLSSLTVRLSMHDGHISASLKLTCVHRRQTLNLSSSTDPTARSGRSTAPNNRIVNVHWLRRSHGRPERRSGRQSLAYVRPFWLLALMSVKV